ncbi:hypothetical protein CN126_12295 [Sinorhizobium meliloti]|uniref:hypothetical protein n=1 Tax=Rhizobium meliloti TaxID=382 RepID=UPI000FD7BF7B|nr:hypothetical protein [Sinorhizobium meliloti]RVK61905.1 hypothetical protein CN162_01270 [Sinorhizobium meliloti]RVM76937.1 hypothetical protein CN126_12295 [Sinorhizobium meliloti]RVN73192.1 hypothetical protein CN110_13830 [Sinorhizobium meliloti]
MTVHVRTEEFKPNRTALPRGLVRRRPICRTQSVSVANDEALLDVDIIEIDGIRVLDTEAARAEHAKNVATPHQFEVGDLVDLHLVARGHFGAIVLERHLFAPGPNGGRAVTLLFVDGGPRLITISERYLKLIEYWHWTEEEVALILSSLTQGRANP